MLTGRDECLNRESFILDRKKISGSGTLRGKKKSDK